MKLNTLFKRNVNGSINCWTICIEDNYYYTEFGKVDGVIQASDKTFCEGKNIGKKNETTAQQQALNEAASIWKRKIDIENFVEDINNVDKVTFNPPMLAKVYSKNYTKDIKFIQPKLDGIRCNISINNDGSTNAISRRNKPFASTKHIENELVPFLASHPSIHLDGELYNHELHDDFNKIVSLVKKQKINDNDRQEIERTVKYYIYDLWDDENPNLTFSERLHIINVNLGALDNVVIVPTFAVDSNDEVDKWFGEFISMGYEGAILRLDAPYEHKRSSNLLKYKEFADDEFEILDVNVGKNNLFAESFTIRLNNGNICNATLAFSDEECKEIIDNKEKYIGLEATVKYFGYTNDGMLRFPVVKSINRKNYE